jgi:hypothetical protein
MHVPAVRQQGRVGEALSKADAMHIRFALRKADDVMCTI